MILDHDINSEVSTLLSLFKIDEKWAPSLPKS